jgi:hypothetical protein
MLVVATWGLYVLTFIPFQGEYVIQWLFAFASALGVVVAILALFKVRVWRIAAIVLAVVLLLLWPPS